MKKISFWRLRIKGLTFYVLGVLCRFSVWIRIPWIRAKFYIAFEYYRKDEKYRNRVFDISMRYAVKSFIDSRFDQDYCFKEALKQDSKLKNRFKFFPWLFEMPELLKTVVSQGILEDGGK